MSYPAPLPHMPIEQIRENLYIARGSVKINPLIRFTRNMVILRHEGELSLINPIRLNDEGEAALKALGTVKRVIRTGPMHGMDDPWYVDQFGAEMWAQPGGEIYNEPPIDVEITPETVIPFPDTELFTFQGTLQPECALLVHGDGGLLITCDAVQHYGDYSNCNLPASLMLPFIGFPKRTLIGPIWLKIMTPEGSTLRPEFERLAALPFDALFSAHGTYLASGAKENLKRAIELAFK